MARAGFGRTEFVRPNEDIENAVSQLYNRIGAPAMTDVAITVDVDGRKVEQGPPVNRVYPREAYDLFAGDQLVVVGRYSDPGAAKVTITGKVDGAEKSLDFPAQLTETSADETYAFVEKLWAMRRVGEIIDDIDLNGKNEELTNELVALATKHGILTPYTSFLADDQPTIDPGGRPMPLAFGGRRGEALPQAAAEADRALNALSDAEAGAGRDGVEQRALKGQLREAAQAPAPGIARFRRLGAEKEEAVHTIQQVGAKTFYRRGEQWVDSTLTPDQEEKLQKIERFSKEYFDLAAKLDSASLKYLALDGQVVVVLEGQAYAF